MSTNIELSNKLCEVWYPELFEKAPSLSSVFETIGLIAFTIAIECCCYIKHTPPTPKNSDASTTTDVAPSSESPPPYAPAPGNADAHVVTQSSNTESQDYGMQVMQGKIPHWSDNPSKEVRAVRFTACTFLLGPAIACFVLRMQQALPPVPNTCRSHAMPEPAWWWIALLNIVPFVVACTAWLRTLVDCVLARWGKSVRFSSWTPCMPLFLVFMVPFAILFAIWEGCREGMVFLMGGKDEEAREDMEIGNVRREEGADAENEETERLMDAVEGDEEEACVKSGMSE